MAAGVQAIRNQKLIERGIVKTVKGAKLVDRHGRHLDILENVLKDTP